MDSNESVEATGSGGDSNESLEGAGPRALIMYSNRDCFSGSEIIRPRLDLIGYCKIISMMRSGERDKKKHT